MALRDAEHRKAIGGSENSVAAYAWLAELTESDFYNLGVVSVDV
jgi:hypothetical protein